MATTMLCETRDDGSNNEKLVRRDGKCFYQSTCQTFESTDLKAIVAFLKGNCTTGGFSIQFAVRASDRTVVEVMKKGKLCQGDIKALVADGYTEWLFSWCWSPKHFMVQGQVVPLTRVVDLVKTRDILPYARAFGY